MSTATTMDRPRRIGLLVPSSNVTMETELPELFRRLEAPERFTFHSARMRMTSVTPEALAAMNAQGESRAAELADAECDVLAYACLVALMVSGPGAHLDAERRLHKAAGGATPVVTSAGALVDGIHALGVERVAMIAPYAPPLTAKVVDYLRDADIDVADAISLHVTDNCAVGRLDPGDLVRHAERLDLRRAEAIVLSACVQMPSLTAIPVVEQQSGLPTLSAAVATTRALLEALGLTPQLPGAGALLGARVAQASSAAS